jgi:hypothetical protein
LIDKNWFQKLAIWMGKLQKKINSVFNRPVLLLYKYYYCFLRDTSVSQFHGKKSFHFMTQKYQNFRCRVKRTCPKSPTLPYCLKMKEKIYYQKFWKKLSKPTNESESPNTRIFFFKSENFQLVGVLTFNFLTNFW